jgi:hypothetical protein
VQSDGSDLPDDVVAAHVDHVVDGHDDEQQDGRDCLYDIEGNNEEGDDDDDSECHSDARYHNVDDDRRTCTCSDDHSADHFAGDDGDVSADDSDGHRVTGGAGCDECCSAGHDDEHRGGAGVDDVADERAKRRCGGDAVERARCHRRCTIYVRIENVKMSFSRRARFSASARFIQ